MPSFRITALMASLVILGAGYLFFYERNFETTQEREKRRDQVLRIKSDTIKRIKIRRDAWTSALVERIDSQSFRVVEPVEGGVDSAAISRLLSNLEFLKSRDSIAIKRADEKRRYSFGLSRPRLEISLASREGNETRLFFGNSTPIGNNSYLAVGGSDSVFVVDEAMYLRANHLLDRIVGPSDAAANEKDEIQ